MDGENTLLLRLKKRENGIQCRITSEKFPFPAVLKFQYPRVSPGDQPLAKGPEDSETESDPEKI